MKEHIKQLLSEALPAVNLDSDFLFGELDSMGVVTVMMILSNEYDITLNSTDVTPRNFKSLDSLAAMVQAKINA